MDAIEKLEMLANRTAEAHVGLRAEIDRMHGDGLLDDDNPLNHCAQDVLRLEHLLSEFVAALMAEDCDKEAVKKNLKLRYLKGIMLANGFEQTGFARVLVNSKLSK